jgi:hypothetical protein
VSIDTKSANNAKEMKAARLASKTFEEVSARGRDNGPIDIAKFSLFQQQLQCALNSDHFGDVEHSVQPGLKTAGAKELERAGVKEILLKPAFLRGVHQRLREYGRLMEQRPIARQVSKDLGKSIKQLRDYQKTLRSLKLRLIDKKDFKVSGGKPRGLYMRLENILSIECREFPCARRWGVLRADGT